MSTLSSPINCNVLFIGQSGAGKSSFANYLFETDIFATGSGTPVTGWEDNFQQHHFYVSDISVNVYDSVGLEPNNFDRWFKELKKFLSERQSVVSDSVIQANDIIHTLFYIINVAVTRVEYNEMQILKSIRDEYNLPASVILTNCDVATEEEINAVEKIIKKYNFNTYRVCSISDETIGGDKIEPFGKEPAIGQLLSASYEKIGRELTLALLNEAIDFLYDIKWKAKVRIDAADISIFKPDSLDEFDIDSILPDLGDINDLIPPEYYSYQEFMERFNVNYAGRDILNDTMECLESIIGNIDENSISIGRKIRSIEHNFEHGGLFTKIGAAAKGLWIVLNIKQTLKNVFDEMIDIIISELSHQVWNVKNDDIFISGEETLEFDTSAEVVLTEWGIKYKEDHFDLTGVLHGHKILEDGETLGNTSGIVDATVDFDNRRVLFETRNSRYSCSFDDYVPYIKKYEDKWSPGAESPESFDDIIRDLLNDESPLYAEVMSGMINTIAGNLHSQIKESDETINIQDVLKRNFDDNCTQGVKTLCRHLGEDIRFTGSWDDPQSPQEVSEGDLLPGELSASVFGIGGYLVRNAIRVYKTLKDHSEIPAEDEEIAFVLSENEQKFRVSKLGKYEKDIKVVQEISAKRIDDKFNAFNTGFIVICHATESFSWFESIHYICALLTPPDFTNDNELLFVNRYWIGSSSNSETWYCLNPYGTVKSYKHYPWDADSRTQLWDIEDNDTEQNSQDIYNITDYTESHIIPDSFIATSDFHANEWPLKKVSDYYVNEYDKVFILGDAIDRGPENNGKGSIAMLCKIKELTEFYKDRVLYIPGNHDSFLYDYGKYGDERALKIGLERNGGTQTVKEFKNLLKEEPVKAQELLDWLGKLPIQQTHIYGKQKYAFAHAFFNQWLFSNYPEFCLDDLYNAKGVVYNRGYNVIWFRKEEDDYNPADVPTNDTIVVIGHTPLISRESMNMDLENAAGETVEVHCVDGGITYANNGYDGKMLKFTVHGTASSAENSHNFLAPVIKTASKKSKTSKKNKH